MKKSSTYEIYPSSPVGKRIVINSMLHHYKKISNVKPRIDTNLCNKNRNRVSTSQQSLYISLSSNSCNTKYKKKNIPMIRNTNRICSKKEHYITNEFAFHPLVLDTDAKSKLRTLDVYYPPRKRYSPLISAIKMKIKEQEEWSQNKEYLEEQINTAVLSNSDSAYADYEDEFNGNIMAALERQYQNFEKEFSPKDQRCLPFLQDITDDIIKRNIYTDYSIKQVFNEHRLANRYNLSEEIMEEELENLKAVLDIQEEEEHHDHNNEESEIENRETTLCTSKKCDKAVLSALESLCLNPTVFEKVKLSLGLIEFQHELCKNCASCNNSEVKDPSDTIPCSNCSGSKKVLYDLDNLSIANDIHNAH